MDQTVTQTAGAVTPRIDDVHATGPRPRRVEESLAEGTGSHDVRPSREAALAAGTVVPLGSTLPAVLLDQFHGARNVAASVLTLPA